MVVCTAQQTELVQFDCAKVPFHYVAKLVCKTGEQRDVTYYRKYEQNAAKSKSLKDTVAINILIYLCFQILSEFFSSIPISL